MIDWDAPRQAATLFADRRRFGPFPAPLLSGSVRSWRRWSADYLTLLARQDVRDLTRIAQLDRLESLVEILPGAVASPLSYSSLERDLEVAHTTVRTWLEAPRRLYLLLAIRPHAARLRRALGMERKWYFLDWSHVLKGPARLENLIGSALWQACHSRTDAGHGRFELRYLRTIDRREIGFLILEGNTPRLAVEVKEADLSPSPTLSRRTSYLGRGDPRRPGRRDPDVARRVEPGFWVVSAGRFLANL